MEDQEGAAPEEVADTGGAEAPQQSDSVESAMSQIPGLAESLQSQSAARQAGRVQDQAAPGGRQEGELPAGDPQTSDSTEAAFDQMPELREEGGA